MADAGWIRAQVVVFFFYTTSTSEIVHQQIAGNIGTRHAVQSHQRRALGRFSRNLVALPRTRPGSVAVRPKKPPPRSRPLRKNHWRDRPVSVPCIFYSPALGLPHGLINRPPGTPWLPNSHGGRLRAPLRPFKAKGPFSPSAAHAGPRAAIGSADADSLLSGYPDCLYPLACRLPRRDAFREADQLLYYS